ncbi:MAG: hypothetical protein ACJ735_03180 [Actinomycetes bacterium]
MTQLVQSTLEDVREPQTAKRTRRGRVAALSVLALAMIAGAAGILGVHAGTVATNSNGYRLTVVYPHVARAGQDVPWRATVFHQGGFGQGDVTLAVSSHYFDIFDTQAWHPEPDMETATPNYYYLSFSAPPGDTLEVSYDTYIQPSAQLGRRADVVLIVDNKEVARTSYRTWLVP